LLIAISNQESAFSNLIVTQDYQEGMPVRFRAIAIALSLILLASAGLAGQAPVTGVADPESLFSDPDPKLHANKQVVLHIVRDLLECNHWDQADKWLTPEYIQHNPLVVSGRDAVVKFFGNRPKKPIPQKMQTKIVAVVAEGDLVVVAFPRELKDPKDPSKTYTTTWFDMWRIQDGKAAEHWDGAVKQ
jgi:predicted SnoaL-like aldol condensation-catalyzing enzyme